MNLDAMMIGTLFDQEEVASKKNFYNIAVNYNTKEAILTSLLG